MYLCAIKASYIVLRYRVQLWLYDYTMQAIAQGVSPCDYDMYRKNVYCWNSHWNHSGHVSGDHSANYSPSITL